MRSRHWTVEEYIEKYIRRCVGIASNHRQPRTKSRRKIRKERRKDKKRHIRIKYKTQKKKKKRRSIGIAAPFETVRCSPSPSSSSGYPISTPHDTDESIHSLHSFLVYILIAIITVLLLLLLLRSIDRSLGWFIFPPQKKRPQSARLPNPLAGRCPPPSSRTLARFSLTIPE